MGEIPEGRVYGIARGFVYCRIVAVAKAASHGSTVSERKERVMITGAHVVMYTKDAEADRAFFRDVLGFKNVDAGRGWLIFALPPAEVAMHPAEHGDRAELYLMCSDLKAEIAELVKMDVVFEEPKKERWGMVTKIRLPSGESLGLYEPSHPIAVDLEKN
jgi:hypothetical protein